MSHSHILSCEAIDLEGLFRISGAVLEVAELRKQFDKGNWFIVNFFNCFYIGLTGFAGKKPDLSKVRDPHVVAGVLKGWVSAARVFIAFLLSLPF